MNCSQCGAQFKNGLKFCPQCGARIENPINEVPYDNAEEDRTGENEGYDEETNPSDTTARKDMTRPIAKSVPRSISTNKRINDPKRFIASDKGYEWENRTGIAGFAETLLAIIFNPVGSGEELYIRINKKVTLIYISAMILISSCISFLIYISHAVRVANLFYDMFDYFFGYGTVQYMLSEMGAQVLFLSILSNVLMIVYVTLFIIVVFRILLKVDIEWIECVQLMMMPTVIGFFGKIIVFVLGFISIKAAIAAVIMLSILIAVLAIIQFINRLGLSAVTVYSLPPLYIMSGILDIIIILQILKSYMA